MNPKDCKPGTAVRITVNGIEGIIIGNTFTIEIDGSFLPGVIIMTTKGYNITWTLRRLEKINIRGGTL